MVFIWFSTLIVRLVNEGDVEDVALLLLLFIE